MIVVGLETERKMKDFGLKGIDFDNVADNVLSRKCIWRNKAHFLAAKCFSLQYFFYLCTHNIC